MSEKAGTVVASITLCHQTTAEGKCRKIRGHRGVHAPFPTLWNSIAADPGDKTQKKINKAGFATPRGGAKGGYQNHVTRSSRVILPLEHAGKVKFSNYEQGYTIRVTVPQAVDLLAEKGLADKDGRLQVRLDGQWAQAFVLYRSATELKLLPPLDGWIPCEHRVEGRVSARRSAKGEDLGHYLVRVPKGLTEGIQQGIFAPEYVGREENYACQMLLTYLAYMTQGHPSDENLPHVVAILKDLDVWEPDRWRLEGIVDEHGVTSCPLCGRCIANPELHETIDPSRVPGLENSGVQLDETRSTLVNLYHLSPLLYDSVLGHTVRNIAWGHAHCNTLLAQRRSFTTQQLASEGTRPTIDLYWSPDERFIRSKDGRAWVSVTPVPPGIESFTEYLAAHGAAAAVAEDDSDDEGPED